MWPAAVVGATASRESPPASRRHGDLLQRLDGWEIGAILGVHDLLGNGTEQIIGVSGGRRRPRCAGRPELRS